MTYMWKMALFYPFISRIRCTKEWYSRLIMTFFWECAIKPIFRLSIYFYITHIAPLPKSLLIFNPCRYLFIILHSSFFI